jgi:LEA14-like dessication related protein
LIIGPRRLALFGAIGAVVLTIILYPELVRTPFNPEDVTIQLSRVALAPGGEGDQELDLNVAFNVTNNSDFTLTTSKIEYELFVDGASVGTDTISYEDIPVNGRPALFSGEPPITLRDEFTLKYSDADAEMFNKILNGSEDIQWSVTGKASIESGTTFLEKTFSDEL